MVDIVMTSFTKNLFKGKDYRDVLKRRKLPESDEERVLSYIDARVGDSLEERWMGNKQRKN